VKARATAFLHVIGMTKKSVMVRATATQHVTIDLQKRVTVRATAKKHVMVYFLVLLWETIAATATMLAIAITPRATGRGMI
jgi:hypothetical protein